MATSTTVKSLEELYNDSVRDRVKQGRIAAEGKQEVNFFDQEAVFQKEFVARPHNETRLWLKNAENNENSNFTPKAIGYYSEEYTQFGNETKSNFTTRYIPSNRASWYDSQFGTARTGPNAGKSAPGILFSSPGA